MVLPREAFVLIIMLCSIIYTYYVISANKLAIMKTNLSFNQINISMKKNRVKYCNGSMQTDRFYLLLCLLIVALQATAQQTIPLYPDSIPNSTGYKMKEIPVEWNGKVTGYRNVSQPSLSVYLPAAGTATGSAVVICPGGGYWFENAVPEGQTIAETFIKHGVTAFVLKYRLPSDSIMKDKSIGPLQDAQQAIKLVRKRAKEWNLDPNKIGIMGFSAGGHLASTAATHFNTAYIPNKEGISLRPDFAILIYPVISFTEGLMHKGSRDFLIGEHPTEEQTKLFSNEQQITKETPPTWLTHAGDDTVVPVGNSISFMRL